MSLSNPHFTLCVPSVPLSRIADGKISSGGDMYWTNTTSVFWTRQAAMCSTPFQRRIGAGQNENIEKFIQKVHKYVGVEDLDGHALCELVPAICVDAPDKPSGRRVQHIHTKRDGLGFISLNELMKKETA